MSPAGTLTPPGCLCPLGPGAGSSVPRSPGRLALVIVLCRVLASGSRKPHAAEG